MILTNLKISRILKIEPITGLTDHSTFILEIELIKSGNEIDLGSMRKKLRINDYRRSLTNPQNIATIEAQGELV